MEHAYGLDIPQTLDEVIDPRRTALLVYDMQVGVLSQLPNGGETTKAVEQVLQAARAAGLRVFFSRHMSLPVEMSGVYQLRTAMAWQRVSHVREVKPWFLRDSPGFQIAPELAPLENEAVFDKITMSAFEGTFFNIALRDCDINSFIVVGVALEVGIEPTARHAADLGYIPIVVTDACGGRDKEAMRRSLDGLRFAGDSIITDIATVVNQLQRK